MKTNSKDYRSAYLIVFIVLFFLLIGGVVFLLFGKDILLTNNKAVESNYQDEQLIAVEKEETEPKVLEFTELIGYDSLDINKDNSTITLRNSSNNKVLLKYDVYNNEKLIYTSELLSPGEIVRLNVYELLDLGEYVLEYHISSYDQISKNLLISDIIQKQEIVIS